MRTPLLTLLLFAAPFALASCAGPSSEADPATTAIRSTRYDDLLALFRDWRAFQPAPLVDGVPDYSPAAMTKQQTDLRAYRARLDAIDPSGWPIPPQVDYDIVRAEMNGLDFGHRVLRPWANDPAFYATVFGAESDQPAREGEFARGAVELWRYAWPLDDAAVAEIGRGLRAVPPLLEQARATLVGDGHDLWRFGAATLREQEADLEAFGTRLADVQARGGAPDLSSLIVDATAAEAATHEFAEWVAAQAGTKTGASGIGRENYDWYLRHVQLLPYTWHDAMTLMERELARAHTALALEEARNAALPPSAPVADAVEYDRRFAEGVTEYMAFLRDHGLLTVRDGMDAALRARGGRFVAGPREFFTEVDHHDPMVMRTHGYHWFDKWRMQADPHPDPIRRGALLYNIFVTRTEGHATGWEEMMLQAGMFDRRPRSRELVYVLLAQRAARAQGDLRMHAREATVDQAAAFASANTPRGWLSLDGQLVRGEQHLYLRQPAYGISYVVGKIQIERLLADRRRQMGDAFTFRRFMDEFDAAGLIPTSLLRWELTGEIAPDLREVVGPGAR